jgi:hypothetical protein
MARLGFDIHSIPSATIPPASAIGVASVWVIGDNELMNDVYHQ